MQEDFSELPPNQRRKKLQGKIDDLTAKISQVAWHESVGGGGRIYVSSWIRLQTFKFIEFEKKDEVKLL